MPKDLNGIQISQIAVHEIVRGRRGAGTSVILADQLSELNEDLSTFFESRIIEMAKSNDSFLAEFDSATESPVPELCDDFLRHQTSDLLDTSRAAARHLANVQTGASSGGLLAVIAATHSNNRALVFLKLEHDQGVKIDRSELADGTQIVRLEHVKDLILSARTKLHKQAFIQRSEEAYFLEVADLQRGYRSRTTVARFFLNRFLGARTAIDSRAATRGFFEAVEAFVATIEKPRRQTEIRLDLASELRSRDRMISPARFGQDHLEVGELAGYDAELQERGIPQYFVKDESLIEGIAHKLRMIGENGMSVAGPTTEWANRVTVGDPDLATGEVIVTVRDRFGVR